MSRVLVAIVAGVVGFFVYIALAVVVADVVRTLHWSLQALYFMIAGVACACVIVLDASVR
eukprot:gene9703-9767_t